MNAPETPAPPHAPLDPAFLALLCCPLCAARPPLTFDTERRLLRCAVCGHEFFFAEGDGFPDLRPPVNTPPSDNA